MEEEESREGDAIAFRAYGHPLEMGTYFLYLGQTLTVTYGWHDMPDMLHVRTKI